MTRVSAGREDIKVSVTCLCLGRALAVCTVIMADRSPFYCKISLVPPVKAY